MGPRNGLITQTGDRVQQDRRAHRTPLLLGARFAQALQHALLVLAEDQEPAPPRKGHAPLKHFRIHMSSYLENYDLVLYRTRPASPNLPAHLLWGASDTALAFVDGFRFDHTSTISDRPSGSPLFLTTGSQFMRSPVFI